MLHLPNQHLTFSPKLSYRTATVQLVALETHGSGLSVRRIIFIRVSGQRLHLSSIQCLSWDMVRQFLLRDMVCQFLSLDMFRQFLSWDRVCQFLLRDTVCQFLSRDMVCQFLSLDMVRQFLSWDMVCQFSPWQMVNIRSKTDRPEDF